MLYKGFILQSKGAHFDEIRAAQHGFYTSNLLHTPMHSSDSLLFKAIHD